MKTLAKSLAVSYAFAWHGGQSSALYSFASCGGFVHDEQHMLRLLMEVEKDLLWCQRWINEQMKARQSPAEYLKEPHRLMRLRDFIKKCPVPIP